MEFWIVSGTARGFLEYSSGRLGWSPLKHLGESSENEWEIKGQSLGNHGISDIIGNKELVIHEESGLIVPSKDSKGFAMALTRLYKDRGLLAKIKKHAPQRIATRLGHEQTIEKYGTEEIKARLNEAIPAGADIGEMMLHTSNELTMIYARVPPYFMSAVHNHTLFACIGCLEGKEDNTIYSLQNGSVDLPPTIDRQFTITSGEVIELPHVS